MNKYEVKLTVDGKRTVEVISARTSVDAEKLAKSQYDGCKVNITRSAKRIK